MRVNISESGSESGAAAPLIRSGAAGSSDQGDCRAVHELQS